MENGGCKKSNILYTVNYIEANPDVFKKKTILTYICILHTRQ